MIKIVLAVIKERKGARTRIAAIKSPVLENIQQFYVVYVGSECLK